MGELTIGGGTQNIENRGLPENVLERAMADTPTARLDVTHEWALGFSIMHNTSVVIDPHVVLAEHIGGSEAARMGHKRGALGCQISTNSDGETVIVPVTSVTSMEERRIRLRKEAEERAARISQAAALATSAAIL